MSSLSSPQVHQACAKELRVDEFTKTVEFVEHARGLTITPTIALDARGGAATRSHRGCTRVLPAVRFACDAYVTLVRERTLVEAVASSLTEFFSPDIMARRIVALARTTQAASDRPR